jgi:transposase
MNTPERKNTSTKQRRHFTASQKAAIVKRHLVDGVAVSDLCDELQIQPTQFYQWQKQLFENAAAVFEPKRKTNGPSAADRKIAALEAKLSVKNEVIAELMEENVKAKKECGEL